MRQHPWLGMLCVCVVVFGVVGCGAKSPRSLLAVSGTVTLDGTPLDQGQIQFEPQPAAEGAVNAGAAIKNGKFELAAPGGLRPGNYRVAITSKNAEALPSDPIKAMEAASKPTPAAERIPAQYNSATTLKAEVKAEGPNTFDFALKSDKK
jgi:hypothetical protein